MPTAKKKSRARKKKPVSQPLSRTLKIYQRIAIFFVAVSFLLLLFVLYLSVSAATIRVTPNEQVVSVTASAEVVPEAVSYGQVTGYVVQREVEKTDVFTLPEEGATAQEAKARGLVTIINETGSNQPLVATTRLLSEDGVLFRIEEATEVPAGGQVEVVAAADEAGLQGEIGPTQFTIPGLAASLQSSIYAVSVEPMTGGVVYVRTVTQEDVDAAYERLKDDMTLEAAEAFEEEVDTKLFGGQVIDVEVTSSSNTAVLGEAAGSFEATVTATVTGVYFSESVMQQYAQAELEGQIARDYTLADVNEDGLQLEVRSIDGASQKAKLNVYLDGTSVISTTSDILDVDRFLGRSPSEVETLLEASDFVEEVYINFTPFWLKRMPTLADHIRVVVE